MVILGFDIEASNLSANFGILLTFGSKVVGKGKPEVLNILDYMGKDGDLIKAEKKLLKDVSKRMLDADVWLGHYSQRYDLPFLNSRLLYHRLPVLPANAPHLDTWKIARNRLKLSSNRLNTISEFLNTLDEKNKIKPEEWIRAMCGHRPSMNYIVEHNRRDVLVLEEVYELLKPLVLDHPHKGLLDGRGGCGICGAPPEKQQKRGYHRTRTRVYARFQCQGCGGWHKSPKPIKVLS